MNYNFFEIKPRLVGHKHKTVTVLTLGLQYTHDNVFFDLQSEVDAYYYDFEL